MSDPKRVRINARRRERRRTDPAVRERERQKRAEYRANPVVREKAREYKRQKRLADPVKTHEKDREYSHRAYLKVDKNKKNERHRRWYDANKGRIQETESWRR